jgi:uncharacterized protein YegP (UPF0339 family)
MAKIKRDGEVVKIIKTKTGARWEIYRYKIGGVPQFGIRLIVRNGNLICDNMGLNTIASATKSIKSISKNSTI